MSNDVQSDQVTTTPQPPQNWVLDRAQCTLDLTFDAFAEIVERDVNQMNSLSADQRQNLQFRVERNDGGLNQKFQVQRFLEGQPGNQYGTGVTFVKLRSSIEVSLPEKTFQVVPMWSDKESSCILYVDNKRFETWQISQIALSSFFFDKP